jgi:ADP-heptose:LPS heptosyltransferase
MAASENILLIRLKSIGDVLLTLPAVNAVRENFPASKITFLTSRENAALIRGFTAVDNVIALDRAALKNPWQTIPEMFRLLRQLRAGNFSRVVDFQGYGETAWLTRLTGATDRWGGVYKKSRSWAYTKAIERPHQIHPAAGHLQLLADCGLKSSTVKNNFQLPAEALAAAENFFRAQKLSIAKPTLFLQPFTSSPHKNWPLENFLALARLWQARGGQVIFGGGSADREKLQPAIAAGLSVSAGVPLLVTGGLMQLSTLVVGGDTGAVHLAVALGQRVVMLMASLTSGSPHPFGHPEWAVVAEDNQGVPGIPLSRVAAVCEQASGGTLA